MVLKIGERKMEELKTWLNTVIKVQSYKSKSNIAISSVYPLEESKDKPFSPGQRVLDWNFEYVEFLGEGSISVIHRMRDIESRKEYAVKTIKDSASENPDAVRTFLEEINNYLSLESHENIIQTEQFLIDNRGLPCQFMEFAKGNTLRYHIGAWHQWIPNRIKNEVNIETILVIALGIASGLEYAASKNIFHHDINPENIIITEPDLVPKLIDFGGEISDKFKQENITAFGNLEYSSPEHYNILQYDEQSDIYSFGILLHEMLTGKLPFSFETREDYSAMQLRKAPNISDALSEDFKNIIKGCLNLDKDNRTASFSILIQQLEVIYTKITGSKISDLPNKSNANTRDKLLARASLLKNMGYHLEAINCYEEADIFPIIDISRKDYLLDWSYCLKIIGKAEEANKKISEWESLNKNSSHSVDYFSKKALISDDPEESIYYLKKAIDIDGYNPNYLFGLATVYFSLDHFKKAEEMFLKLVKDHPNDSTFLSATGDFYQINNFSSTAFHYYKEALKYDKLNSHLYLKIIQILHLYEDYIQAEYWVKQGLEKSVDKNYIYAYLIKGHYSIDYKNTAYIALDTYPGDEIIISAIESSFENSNAIFTHPGMIRKKISTNNNLKETGQGEKSRFTLLLTELKKLIENNQEEKARSLADEYINSNPNAVWQVYPLGHIFKDPSIKYHFYRIANNRSGISHGETFHLEINELIEMEEFEKAEARFNTIINNTEFKWYDYYSIANSFYKKGKFDLSREYLNKAELLTGDSIPIDILRFKLILADKEEEEIKDKPVIIKYLKNFIGKYEVLVGSSLPGIIYDTYINNEGNNRILFILNYIESKNKATLLDLRGLLSFSKKNYSEAIEAYSEATQTFPYGDDLWFNLATLQLTEKKYPEAVNSFKKAIRINRKNDLYWFGLGHSFFHEQELEKAEKCYRIVTRLKPENASYWKKLAYSQSYQGKFSKAEESYDKAIYLDPTDDDAWYNKGLTLYEQKIYDKAENHFQKAVDLMPENILYREYLGETQIYLKKYFEAEISFDEITKRNPGNANYWNTLAIIRMELDRYQDAEENLRKALELSPDDPIICYNLGTTLGIQQKYEDAEIYLKKAIELDPNNPEFKETLKRLESRLKN